MAKVTEKIKDAFTYDKLGERIREDYFRDFVDYLETLEVGATGDIVLVLTPATLGSSAATVNEGGFTRDVKVEVQDSNGNLHKWVNCTIPVSIGDTSTSGSASISVSDVTIDDGEGSVAIDYTGTWASAETCTLTVSGSGVSLLGTALTDETSVDTLAT